jgi:hypothetical protein
MGRIEARVEASRAAGKIRGVFTVRHAVGTVAQDGYEGLLKATRDRLAWGG